MLGFSVSLSGLRVGLSRLDVAANNIANILTPGFKASRVDAVDISPGGASVGSIRINFNPGPIEITDGGFSLAIDGTGFFRIQTPEGERFSRAGSFGFDAAGNIVTAEGGILLPNIQVPPDAQSIVVGQGGVVSAVMPDGTLNELGQISLVRFPNPGGLIQEGHSLSSASPAAGEGIEGVPGEGAFGSLVFGAVEGSNVDLTSEIVSIIISRAAVKANLAMLRVQNEVLGTVIDLSR